MNTFEFKLNRKYCLKGIEKTVYEKATFDEIAPIAIYLYADVLYEKAARKALAGLKRRIKELRGVKLKEIYRTVDIGVIYNAMFEDIVHGEGLKTYCNEYGSLGFYKFWGDNVGHYPYYEAKVYLLEGVKRAKAGE